MILRKTTIDRTRTLYIAKRDLPIWQEVVEFCKTHDIALSKFVAQALHYYLRHLHKP